MENKLINKPIKSVSDNLKRFNIGRDARVIVAFSGGRDSVTLLDIMHKLAPDFGYTLEAAYVNHNLRGDDSADEAEFVARFTSERGIRLHMRSIGGSFWDDNPGISIEMAARKFRYVFFRELIAGQKNTFIATAHNLDDRIETLFLQLLRAGGMETLSGIPNKNGRIIRPLLDTDRAEIDRYTGENSLTYVDDKTNFQPVYQRNIIRLRLMDVVRRLNPRYIDSFRIFFDNLDGDIGIFSRLVKSAEKRLCYARETGFVAYNLNLWSGTSFPMRKNIVKLAVKRLGFPARPSKAMFNALRCSPVSYKSGSFVMRSYGKYLWLIDGRCVMANGMLPAGYKLNEFHYDPDLKYRLFFNKSVKLPLTYGIPSELDIITVNGRQIAILTRLKKRGIPPELFGAVCVVKDSAGRVVGYIMPGVISETSQEFLIEPGGTGFLL